MCMYFNMKLLYFLLWEITNHTGQKKRVYHFRISGNFTSLFEYYLIKMKKSKKTKRRERECICSRNCVVSFNTFSSPAYETQDSEI